MYLSKDASIALFLRSVSKCNGAVLFCTAEDDVLNLKSILSKFVFATIGENKDVLYSGKIILKDETDYEILGGFLTDSLN